MANNWAQDPQQLLPRELRARWAVVPKAVLYQMVIVGAIIGAGAAVSTVGFVVGPRWMVFGFPAALGLAQMQNMLIPWTRRAERAMEEVGEVPERGEVGGGPGDGPPDEP